MTYLPRVAPSPTRVAAGERGEVGGAEFGCCVTATLKTAMCLSEHKSVSDSERGVVMRFAVGLTHGGAYSWWLYGGNNDQVAWAGETFASEYNARRAAEAFRAGAQTARYEVYAAYGSAWRWRAWRSSSEVASCGESFASKWNAERAAESVRLNAGQATEP